MRVPGSVPFAAMSTIKVFLIKVITHDCVVLPNCLIVTLEVSAGFVPIAFGFFFPAPG